MKLINTVNIIFENKKREILLVFGNPKDPEGGVWRLVGGQMEPGEESLQAAIREAREEIGVRVDQTNLVFIKSFQSKQSNHNIHRDIYKSRRVEDFKGLDLVKSANTKYQWFTPEQAYHQKDLQKSLYTVLEIVYELNQPVQSV